MRRAHFQLYPDIDPFPAGGRKTTAEKRSSNFCKLAVQLTLAPNVNRFEFVVSLPLSHRDVPIEMMVADRDDGRVAFDIVDERPPRDIDSEGLLLIALDQHGIRHVETDGACIRAEPRATNCSRIWRHRDLQVEHSVFTKIDRALTGRELSIDGLGDLVGLRKPLPTICALLCRRVLYTDIATKFCLSSFVGRRVDRTDPAPRLARNAERKAEP